MALVVKDRVQETTITIGTISFVLAGAVTGFQSFSAIGNGNTTYYAVVGGTEWEVGIGTYTLIGTVLSRDTILASSNNGSAVNFSVGTKNIFVTYPAGKGIYTDASGNAIALGTPASATLTNATGLPLTTGVTGTLPIANGGTGTTSTTFTNLTTNVTGTLPVANGGTGITSLGTGVATFLGTPSSANLATAVTDETGSGALVFGTSPTIASPTFTSQSTFAAGTAAAPSVTTTGDTNTGIFFPAADTIAFAEGGTEAMRIDSSGNVGIGVTPSAWSSKAGLQITGSGGVITTSLYSSGASTNGAGLVTNAYNDGTNWKYINATSFGTSRVELDGSNVAIQNAPAGTAGNNVTFTERIRIAESGQIGIGGANYGTSGQVLTSGGASAAVSWADSGAYTLLGTLTTTSGASQTLSSLTLTNYKFLVAVITGVSSTSTGGLRLIDGATNLGITGAGTAATRFGGTLTIDLSSGALSSVISPSITSATPDVSAASIYGGMTNYTTASTSIVFGITTGTFDLGSIKIYGVK